MNVIKRIMRKFRIDEIAGVDLPAMEGARAVFMKRAPEQASGDSAQVEESETPQENEMADTNTAAEVTTLKSELEVAKAYGLMTDAEKAIHKSLGAAEQAEFLKQTPEQRIRKAAESDPIVHTALDGTLYRKSAGEAVIALAKRADRAEQDARAAREQNETSTFAKRAGEELPNFPGDAGVKVAVLRAVEGIADAAVRKSAKDMLKAGNDALAPAFVNSGTSLTSPDSGSPEAVIEKRARELMKVDTKLNYYDAYAKAADADPVLFNKAVDGQKEG